MTFATHSTPTRPLRYFKNHYICEECTPLGAEWSDCMLTISHSWCPQCDAQVEPYSSEAIVEEVPWDDDLYEDAEDAD